MGFLFHIRIEWAANLYPTVMRILEEQVFRKFNFSLVLSTESEIIKIS
jgi:hypothetical protein